MDLIIRGIEMPMPLCKTELIVFPSGVVQVYDSRETCLGKAEAVPLPEGHGKIIDADAIWRNMPDDQAWVFQRGLASDLELFEILEAAEAIIPAEGGTEK